MFVCFCGGGVDDKVSLVQKRTLEFREPDWQAVNLFCTGFNPCSIFLQLEVVIYLKTNEAHF